MKVKVIVRDTSINGWEESLYFARVPIVGDMLSIPNRGADRKVDFVLLFPFSDDTSDAQAMVDLSSQ